MPTAVVTGAFSFTGRFIAQELLARGWTVRTLTNSSYPADPLAERIPASPLQFADHAALARSMEGADTLFNTYWVRYPHAGDTFESAVDNTRVLCQAASEAGVNGVVQVGVVNAAEHSQHPYLSRKWRADEALRATGIPHAIVQPTLIYGHGDVLVNNICWMLRRIPAFFVPGDGLYPIQPVAGEDVAKTAVDLVEGGLDGQVQDVAGPDTYTYTDFVRLLRSAVGSHAAMVRTPAPIVLAAGKLVGRVLHDIVVTGDELRAMMDGTLASSEPPTGSRRLADWLAKNADGLGRRWVRRETRHLRF